jgi:hypothetical protein
MVAVAALTRCRLGISAVMAEILKFFDYYDDIIIRGLKAVSKSNAVLKFLLRSPAFKRYPRT